MARIAPKRSSRPTGRHPRVEAILFARLRDDATGQSLSAQIFDGLGQSQPASAGVAQGAAPSLFPPVSAYVLITLVTGFRLGSR